MTDVTNDDSLSEEEKSRVPFPQFNPFRSWVKEELTRRALMYDASAEQSALAPSTPFIRFTSCQEDVEKQYAYFSLGLHGFDEQNIDIFAQTYRNKDIVGYALDLKTNKRNRLISSDELTAGQVIPAIKTTLSPNVVADIDKKRGQMESTVKKTLALGAHPIPGITNVSVKRRNLGAPMTLEVTWECFNRAQLEFLRNHFMIAGRYVVLEWGHQFANRKLKKILDFTKSDISDTLSRTILLGRRHVIDTWVKPNGGNYDFVVGTTGQFNIQLDAKTNTYTCTTTIYSMGENMYGFNIYNTAVRPNDPTRISSLSDFFQYGSAFDNAIMMASNNGDTKSVAPPKKNEDVNFKDHTDAKEVKNTPVSPNDDIFISWPFFATTIMEMLYVSFEQVDGLNSDILKFTQLVSATDANNPDGEDWVSDNVHLKSTNPETMLIVTSRNPIESVRFSAGGYFDKVNGGDGWRGKLTAGVWLNSGMIREVFLGSTDVAQAFKTILMRMNNATAGFWNLQLFYDEEINGFKVIDANCVNSKISKLPVFYRFNSGSAGESLEIELDSAYPPELITQMALYATLQSSDAPTQEKLLKRYPHIGTTSPFMFSLNWTNLVDKVQPLVAKGLPKFSAPNPLNACVPNLTTTQQGASLAVRVIGTSPNVIGPYLSDTPTGNSSLVSNNTSNAFKDTTFKFPASTGPNDPNNPKKNQSIRMNNPGNIKATATNGLPRGEVVKLDGVPQPGEYWAKFGSIEEGFMELVRLMDRYKVWFPGIDLRGTLAKYFVPSPDNNNFEQRLSELREKLRAKDTTKLITIDSYSIAVILSKQESQLIIENGPPIKPVDENTNFIEYLNQKNGPPSIPLSSMKPSTIASVPQQQTLDATLVSNTIDKAEEVGRRFGVDVMAMIEMTPSTMRNLIVQDGYLNYPRPNAFVCPFPVTTSVTITIQGVSGLSVSDGFYVDKLPFVFDNYGVFQVTEIIEQITPRGWFTQFRGYFKLLFLNGEGKSLAAKTEITAKPLTRTRNV